MTDNIKSISDQGLRYTSPRVKVVEVKAQHVLCGSDPSLIGWGNGSESDGGEMIEEE